MEEKPGVMPMFETMIFKSFLRHDLADDVLDLATNLSVSSMRVPDGALTLMTNWPGSVRGK